jgi:hypothetical protein
MKLLIMAVFATAAVALGSSIALANPSPNGHGQPGRRPPCWSGFSASGSRLESPCAHAR